METETAGGSTAMRIPTFDLLIFDLDGVLVNTSPCHSRAFEMLWKKIGIAGPPYEKIAGRSTRDVVVEYAAPLQPSPSRLQDWIRLKQTEARKYISTEDILYPDTAGALTMLSRNGIRLVLATGASRETANRILNRFEMTPFFPVMIAADDVATGKPDPEIYVTAITRMGGIPERALVIEDSAAGLAAAIASGAFAASVRTGTRIRSGRFVGAFPGLQELLAHLDIS